MEKRRTYNFSSLLKLLNERSTKKKGGVLPQYPVKRNKLVRWELKLTLLFAWENPVIVGNDTAEVEK